VLDVRRSLDKVVETASDLTKMTMPRRFSADFWTWSEVLRTCFTLKMSGADVYVNTFSRSPGGSLSVSCGAPVGFMVPHMRVT